MVGFHHPLDHIPRPSVVPSVLRIWLNKQIGCFLCNYIFVHFLEKCISDAIRLKHTPILSHLTMEHNYPPLKEGGCQWGKEKDRKAGRASRSPSPSPPSSHPLPLWDHRSFWCFRRHTAVYSIIHTCPFRRHTAVYSIIHTCPHALVEYMSNYSQLYQNVIVA